MVIIFCKNMDEFLHLLQCEMEKPGIFSWFHLIAFILIIAATFLVSFYCRDVSEKVYKRILLFTWITLIVLEIIKQVLKSFHYGSPSYWEFPSGDFPFHICSMNYYFLPLIIFIDKEKHPKIVDAAIGYMCFICVFTGTAVCVYTDMVMSNLIYTNVQSLIHHGALVIIGVYIFVWNRKTISIKTTYRTFIAFVITASIATIINVIVHPLYINMFYINPFIITNLPLGNIVQENLGYPLYLVLYFIGMSIIIVGFYFIETSIYKLIIHKNKH